MAVGSADSDHHRPGFDLASLRIDEELIGSSERPAVDFRGDADRAAGASAAQWRERGSEAALVQSLARLSSENSGWITMEEGRHLFSPIDDQYAFGEADDDGRSNLARFGRQHDVRFDIMPFEGRIYFSRAAR